MGGGGGFEKRTGNWEELLTVPQSVGILRPPAVAEIDKKGCVYVGGGGGKGL